MKKQQQKHNLHPVPIYFVDLKDEAILTHIYSHPHRISGPFVCIGNSLQYITDQNDYVKLTFPVHIIKSLTSPKPIAQGSLKRSNPGSKAISKTSSNHY